MPKQTPPASDPGAMVQARVLSDCAYGNCGDVIEIAADQAAGCLQLDTTPEAVAYAASVLAQAAERDAPGGEQR